MNEKALWNLSYGLYVITTWKEGKPTGCTANSVLQITNENPTVVVSLNHNNYTNECIKETNKFAISVLTEKVDPSLIGNFGFQSGRNVDKFASIPYKVKDNLPVIDDSCAYLVCDVINTMETETHTIFLGRIVGADVTGNETPLTYANYHKLIKGGN